MATIRLELYLLLLCCSLNFAIGGDCPASAPTVAIVDKCPTNETEMEKAAQRKKCDMMKGVENCDQPPVYHCLLNQWGNATVEVCTSPWYISGFCTIYNTEQMKVMDDFNRDCTKFSEGKCPSRYHSPEAYLYQSCYNNSANPPPSHQQSNGSDNTAVVAVLGVFIVLLLVLIIILILERQEIIQKIGLPIRTCRDIETGKSTDDSGVSQKLLPNESPQKHRQKKHFCFSKRKDAKESKRKSKHKEAQDLTLADGKNDFEAVNDSETLSNLKVTSDNQSTNTDQEKKRETDKSDIDLGNGETSTGNEARNKGTDKPCFDPEEKQPATSINVKEMAKEINKPCSDPEEKKPATSINVKEMAKEINKPCSDPEEKQPASSINVKEMAKEINKPCSDPEEKQPATNINVKEMAKEINKPCSDPKEKQPATSINVKEMAKEINKPCSDPEEKQPATNINVKEMAKEINKPCSDPEKKQPAASINVKEMAKEINKPCSDPEEEQPATNINVKQRAKEIDDNDRSMSNLNK